LFSLTMWMNGTDANHLLRRNKMQKEPKYFGKHVFDQLERICKEKRDYEHVLTYFPKYIVIKTEKRQSDVEQLLKKIYSEHGVGSKYTCTVEYIPKYGEEECVVATVHELHKPNCSFAVYEVDGRFVVDFHLEKEIRDI